MSRSVVVVLLVRKRVFSKRIRGEWEFSLTFTLQNPSESMSLLLITHFVERAAGAEPRVGTSRLQLSLGAG